MAAMNEARIATSVLPYPASPQTSLSIGRGRAMSALTSSMTRAWSGVSRYGNEASNCCIHSGVTSNAMPGHAARRAWVSSSDDARSATARSAAAFSRVQRLPPSLCSRTPRAPPTPM